VIDQYRELRVVGHPAVSVELQGFGPADLRPQVGHGCLSSDESISDVRVLRSLARCCGRLRQRRHSAADATTFLRGFLPAPRSGLAATAFPIDRRSSPAFCFALGHAAFFIACACRYIWIFHLTPSPTSSFHPVALKAEELNLFLRKPRSDRFSSKFERGGTLKMNCRCPVDQGFTRGGREIDATQRAIAFGRGA
jgi:hypothetical protein